MVWVLEVHATGRMVEVVCASHQEEGGELLEVGIKEAGVRTMNSHNHNKHNKHNDHNNHNNHNLQIDMTTILHQHYNPRKLYWIIWACISPRSLRLPLLSATFSPHLRKHMQGEQSGVNAAADDPWGLCMTPPCNSSPVGIPCSYIIILPVVVSLLHFDATLGRYLEFIFIWHRA
jgi:hypothetical protein